MSNLKRTPTHSSNDASTPTSGKRIRKSKIRFAELEFPSSHQKKHKPEDAVYNKGDYLAIRAEHGKFYICEALQNVHEHHPMFRARWLELQTSDTQASQANGRSLYTFVYEERLSFDAIVTQVHLEKVSRGLMGLSFAEKQRVTKLVKAAENGVASELLDEALFEPPEKKAKMDEIDGETSSSEKITNKTPPAKKRGWLQQPKEEKRPKLAKNTSPIKHASPTKTAALIKKATLAKKASLAKQALLTSNTSPTKKASLTKTASLTKKGSLTKKPCLSKQATMTLKPSPSKSTMKKAGSRSKKPSPSKKKTASMSKKNSLSKKRMLSKVGSLTTKPSLTRKPSITKKNSVSKATKLVKKARLKKTVSKEMIKKALRIKGRKLDPNRKLVPNDKITVWEENPLYHTRETIPFVSTEAHNNLVMRAVQLNDINMLKKLIADKEKISKLNSKISIHQEMTPYRRAMQLGNKPIIQLLQQELWEKPSPRAAHTTSFLAKRETGRYNKASLGLRYIRKVQVSRGGREGNNALTKSPQNAGIDYLDLLIKEEIPIDMIDFLKFHKRITYPELTEKIYKVVRSGNRRLASKLVELGEKYQPGELGLNEFHKEALAFDKKDFTKPLREISARKTPTENAGLTPIHFASINPNPKYLKALLSVLPSYNLQDDDLWRPVHYAAVCEGTGPLQLLFARGVSFEEVNKEGLSPVHLACQHGRHENVDFILRCAEEKAKSLVPKGEEYKPNKFGVGEINKPLKNGWCPIHYATACESKETIDVLMKYGADIDKPMNATNNKITALIMATQAGNMQLVKHIISHRAKIARPDKRKRTALIHAVRDGHAHLVSYFLSLGCDPNEADSSGNTALHYAAAYGWYYCLLILLEAGAHADTPNDWKLTPMAASYLRGHRGLTNILLEIPGVNINFQDDEGMTMLMKTVSSSDLDDELYETVRDLVEVKRAKIDVRCKSGHNVLYYLLVKSFTVEPNYGDQEFKQQLIDKRETEMHVAMQVAELLVENGCDLEISTSGPEYSILRIIINKDDNQIHLDLLMYLVTKLDTLPAGKTSMSRSDHRKGWGETILHALMSACNKDKVRVFATWVIETAVKNKRRSLIYKQLTEFAKQRDKDGKTPFKRVCEVYGGMYLTREAHNELIPIMELLLGEFKSQIQYEWNEEYKCSDGVVKTNRYAHTALEHILAAHSWHYNKMLKGWQLMRQYKPDLDMRLTDGHPLIMKYALAAEHTVVKLLLEDGANVDVTSSASGEGEITTLLAALKNSNNTDTKMLKMLLNAGADTRAVVKNTQKSAMHFAVLNTHYRDGCTPLSIVKLLLEHGALLDPVDLHRRTPLHLVANKSKATADEEKDIEYYLIKKGADLYCKDEDQRLPIHYLFVKFVGHDCSSIDPVESFTMFAGAMNYTCMDATDCNHQTILHHAAYRGATVCCMLLIQKGCEIDVQDKDGNTPLSLAVWKQHESCALTLVQKGADINTDIINHPNADVPPDTATDADETEVDETYASKAILKRVATMERTIRQNLVLVKKCPIPWLRRHQDVPWKPGSRSFPIFQGIVHNSWQGLTFLAMDLLEPFGMEYMSAIEIAIRLKKYYFAHSLIIKQMNEEKLQVKNDKQQNLLHILASTAPVNDMAKQITKVLEELIHNHTFDIDAQDSQGFTALQYAALRGNWLIFTYLLSETKADVNIEDNYARNSLAAVMWPMNNACPELWSAVDKLSRRVTDIDALYDFPPVNSLTHKYEMHVDVNDYCHVTDAPAGATESGTSNGTSNGGSVVTRTTPLIHAVQHQIYHCVYELLKNGADCNAKDSRGMTALMYAALHNDVFCMEILLSDITKVDVQDMFDKKKEYYTEVRDLKRKVPQPTEKNMFADIKTFVRGVGEADVTLQDNAGRTALHHYLLALPCGAYESLHVIKLLHTAGCSLDIKDYQGNTPLYYAMQRSVVIAQALQQLQGLTKREMELPRLSWPALRDMPYDSEVVPDFEADADKFLQELTKDEKEESEHEIEPDYRVKMGDGCVLKDSEQNVYYDILMSKVDVKVGKFGLYNFYKMQILHDTDKDLYILFNCWGRIGDDGQYQHTPFGNKEECVKEFVKIFKAKSGNEWSEVKSFEIKPGKYRPVEANYRFTNELPDVRFDLSSERECKLPQYIQDMILELTSVNMLNSALHGTGTSVPFGRLKEENLVKAKAILYEIRDLVTKKEKLEPITMDTRDEYWGLLQKISERSSEYYYLVPKKGYEYEQVPPLDDMYKIDKHITDLMNMFELHVVGRMLLGAQLRKQEMNPLDYIYLCLGSRIQMLKRDDPEVPLIMQYVYNSGERTDVFAIYRFSHKSIDAKYNPAHLHNKRLLWHGSRTSNLLSILKEGLLTNPRNAQRTGSRFGKGIYAADSFQKSRSYCYNDGGGKTKYMLLCEFALGKVKRLDNSYYDDNDALDAQKYDSMRAVGSLVPDRIYDATHYAGPTIPLGPHTENYEPYLRAGFGRTTDNEYIVNNNKQIAIRYIVQFQ